jgi:hypothetical protein
LRFGVAVPALIANSPSVSTVAVVAVLRARVKFVWVVALQVAVNVSGPSVNVAGLACPDWAESNRNVAAPGPGTP